MQAYQENISAKVSGVLSPVLGVQVTVTDTATGNPAALYSDNGVTSITQPLVTDDTGYFGFYAPNGQYKASFSSPQISLAPRIIQLYDPADDSPLTQAQAAAASGASKIGVGSDTVENALNALQLPDYAALRGYSGGRQSVHITGYLGTAVPSGIAGTFVRDDHDTGTPDNGGTIIVSANGKRWRRSFSGEALPEWFGAQGFGVDDTAAVQAAMSTGRYRLTSQYTITSKLTAPANSRGVGPGTLSKGANCDMLELASGAKISGITLIGNGSTRTGRGVIITGGSDQRIVDCDVLGMDGYCVEHTASQAGLRGSISGGMYYRNTLTSPAIKYPDSETNGDRRLLSIDCGGGVLADLAGSSTTMISGCDTTGLIFNSATKKAVITGNRFAILGGTMTILGIDSIFEGNCMAGNLIVGAGSQNNTIGRNSFATGFAVRDQSGNSTNYVDTLGEDFVPQWLASGTSPSIGNGTILGRVTRVGKRIKISVEIAFGSTTTFGTGNYTFKLPPEYDVFTVKAAEVGAAQSLKAGVAFHTGSVIVSRNSIPNFNIYSEGGSNSWGNTVPVTWANNDSIKFSCEFEIG